MKKQTWLILLGGVLLAVAAYGWMYLAGTAPQRAVDNSATPALAWLKREYGLSDAQFAHLCKLHDAYRPQCRRMCRQIDAKNAAIAKLLAATNTVTPQIKQALADAARLRAQCKAAMFEHFYQVARTMPPEQGQRYLHWVEEQTLEPRSMMMMPGGTHTVSPPATP